MLGFYANADMNRRSYKKNTNHSNGFKPVMKQIKYLVSVNSYVNQVCTLIFFSYNKHDLLF